MVRKLDQLLEVVKGLDTKIQEQDVRIQKQEERVSLRDVSALPSAQSSPKADKDLQPAGIFQSQKVAPSSGLQTQCCFHFNKGQCKYDNEHIANGILYQHYCSFCMTETQKKYDHPLNKCLRVKTAKASQKMII